jgi:hypothetical protein
MRDVSELEAERVASSFRPNRKPLIVTVVANAVMALVLLGIPYLRGRSQAYEARATFGDLSRCLMGGEIAKQPGLSLPQGDREHFAGKVMLAGPDWPLSCQPVLQKLAPEKAIFLWPSVKQAGMDLRAAVELAQTELTSLDKRRKQGLSRVPERVLQALKRVQAATVLLARAGGADAGIDNDAIAWDKPALLAQPARLPLMASDEATLDLYSTGTALEALALDGRGVSYLRVADGKVDRERVKRTSFVRGALRSGSEVYLVWAMPDARCGEREDQCAGRPTGLAPYDKGAAALREPKWKIAGHPAGRVDRVLQLTAASQVWMLARGSRDGGAALLRFELPQQELPEIAKEGGAHSIDETERIEVSAPAPALATSLIPGVEPAAALVVHTDAADAEKLAAAVVWGDPKRAPTPLPGATGEHPWTLGCKAASGLTLAYGSDRQLRVAQVATGPSAVAASTTPAAPSNSAGSSNTGASSSAAPSNTADASTTTPLATTAAPTPTAAPTSAPAPATSATPAASSGRAAASRTPPLTVAAKELLSQDVALPGAIHSEDARLDRVRLLCRDDGAQLFWISATLELWTSTCTADSCSEPRSLAKQVSTVAVLPTSEGALLALGNPADQVRVVRIDRAGAPLAPPLAPAPCFEPPNGMCGTPSLVADAQRIVLVARDRSDLLALESTDGAKSFVTLSGLAGAGTIEQSTTSPLEQHRRRKGIE